MKIQVLRPRNLPSKPPSGTTLLMVISQHIFGMPGWCIGMLWTGIGLLWLFWVVALFVEDYVDIFEAKK